MSPSAADPPMITPLCSIFRQFLKRRGLKFTAERAQVLDAVLTKSGVFEADQLLSELRSAGHHASKATIYRTLKHLLEAGIVNEVLIDSRQTHYELSFGRDPTGHLVCVRTGRIVEFPLAELDSFIKRVCDEHGYEYDSHRVVVYGLSPEAPPEASESPEAPEAPDMGEAEEVENVRKKAK
jgi:Fur family ferric uptake transcriptional regulator